MLVLSVVLILGAIVMGSCSAQESTNYLKIKGKILNEYTADVYVYVQDEVTDKWVRTTAKRNKSKYNLRLATDKNYQIFFIGNGAPTKIVHIKSGETPGMYHIQLDIDYTDCKERYACLYQENDNYIFQTKMEFFTASLE